MIQGMADPVYTFGPTLTRQRKETLCSPGDLETEATTAPRVAKEHCHSFSGCAPLLAFEGSLAVQFWTLPSSQGPDCGTPPRLLNALLSLPTVLQHIESVPLRWFTISPPTPNKKRIQERWAELVLELPAISVNPRTVHTSGGGDRRKVTKPFPCHLIGVACQGGRPACSSTPVLRDNLSLEYRPADPFVVSTGAMVQCVSQGTHLPVHEGTLGLKTG